MSVTLVKDATTVTLPNPITGTRLTENKRQAIARTQGGTVKVQDQGVDTYEASLSWNDLSATEKSDLQSFFHTTADGAVNTWIYTDEDTTSYTARFLDAKLDFTKTAKGVYGVSIRLELSAMGA